MEIVHKNAYFRAETDFWCAFCKNGNSIKWKFDQEFTSHLHKNGIPFYREHTVRYSTVNMDWISV